MVNHGDSIERLITAEVDQYHKLSNFRASKLICISFLLHRRGACFDTLFLNFVSLFLSPPERTFVMKDRSSFLTDDNIYLIM